jgi:hypothetical protein
MAAPPVVLPGLEHRFSSREESAGRALATVLDDPDVSRLFGRHWTPGRGLLVVDVEDPGLRRLPWELLSESPALPPLEPRGEGLVARLALQPQPPSRRHADATLHAIAWSPTSDDPICAAMLDQLDALGAPSVTTVTDAPTVLHVVCHGDVVDAQTVVRGDDGRTTALGDLVPALQPILPSTGLVVLHVCHGGHETSDPMLGLAARLVACGARACLASHRAVPTDIVGPLTQTLHARLRAGETIASAVRDARRAVAVLGIPHPRYRWWSYALHLGDPSTIDVPLVRQTWWTAAILDADLVAWLDRATDVATATAALDSASVGIEHLLQTVAPTGPTTAALRRAVAQVSPSRWSQLSAGLRLRPCEGVRPTPWLAGRLTDGMDAEALAEALRTDPVPSSLLPDVAEAPDDSTTIRLDEESVRDAVAAHDLHVLAGPEGGRRLQPSVGAVVGRASSTRKVDQPLYRDTPMVDASLGRQVLRWLGPGQVEVLRALTLHRGHTSRRVEPGTALELELGDTLELTPSTLLVAR